MLEAIVPVSYTSGSIDVVSILAQNPSGPMGADFGKASPIGLLVIVLLLVVVLAIGWDLTRRLKRMRKRRAFAEKHQMDPFDLEAIDKAMAEHETIDPKLRDR